MTAEEEARRLPVWVAFSDLFLDTETQPGDYVWIARACSESGYGRAELRRILLEEVGPVFSENLLLVAGTWDLFPREYVLEAMRRQVRSPKSFPWPRRRYLAAYCEAQWDKIEALLQGAA